MLLLQIDKVTSKRNSTKFHRTFVNGSFLVSWLISLFILFGLGGCSSTNTTPAKTVAYSLYNEELDFVSSSNEIDLTEKTYDGSYKVVRLYTVPNVKEIQTQEDLENIALDLDSSYILLNDSEWTPIGTEDELFEGILNPDASNGERYTINGLNINLDSDNIGFFGYIKNAILKNITLTVDKMIGSMNTGTLAEKAIHSTITNRHIVGNISSGEYAGSTITNGITNIF